MKDVADILKVGGINGVTLAVSVSEIEAWMRIALIAATLVYTVVKIKNALKEKA